MKKKLFTQKNLEMSMEGAHSKFLSQLFVMPLLRYHDGKVERKYKI